MKIGIKLRCYPDKLIQQLIHQTAGNNRFLYNYFLDLRTENYQQIKAQKEQASRVQGNSSTVKNLSSYDCIKLIPILKKQIFRHYLPSNKLLNDKNHKTPAIDYMKIIGEEFALLEKNYFLQKGWSTAMQQVVKDLDNAFNKFFKKQGNYPQFQKKSYSGSITLTPNNWKLVHVVTGNRLPDLGSNSHNDNNIAHSTIDNCGQNPIIQDYHLYLSGCDKPLTISLDKREFNPSRISKITLSYNASGQYFISFLVDEDINNIKKKNVNKSHHYYLKNCHKDTGENSGETITSIDVGIKNTLNIRANSVLENTYLEKKIKGLERHNKQLRKAQKSLSRKKKHSKNYQKQRIKVATLHQKLVNTRNDFYHKESTKIVLESDTVVIENLNIKGICKNRRQAKAISQQAWGLFFTMLSYKCEWYNKTLVKADRFFPSSKLCSHCHQVNTHVKRQDTWQCTHCQTMHQRDENATMNLFNYSQYSKVGKNFIHHSHLNNKEINKELNHTKINSCKNQAEVTKINKPQGLNNKLTESSGEYNTVEVCKTGDNFVITSNACEAVNRNL